MNAGWAGFGAATRLVLRRNWLRMTIWGLILPVLVVMVITTQADLFPTQESRDQYAAIANTPTVAALTGLPYAAATLGGILNIKLWMTNAITLSLVSIFLVTRNGRAEEESGRLELLRSGRLGRHALSVAGWGTTAAFAILTGLLCGIAAIIMGLPVEGSLLMGLSYSGLALAFIGVAAFTGQVFPTGRAANSWAAVALAAAYLVRAIADVNAEGDTPSRLSWLSPIGWAQQTRSFGENQWIALLPLLGLAVVGLGAALAVESRRDLGAGLIADRAGSAHAAPATRTVIGLPLRLQRTALISWTLGVAVAGAFFGGIAMLMAELVTSLGDNPLGTVLGAGADSQLDGLLGYLLLAIAVLVTGFAVQNALVLRTDEAAGLAEWEWTAAVSRLRWAGARLAIAAAAALVMLALGGGLMGLAYGAQSDDWSRAAEFAPAALAYGPAVLLIVAITAVLVALLPRAAIAIAWSLYGVVVLLAVLGDVLGLPHSLVASTPFWATPRFGAADDPSWLAVWLMGIGAGALALVAIWRIRSRDVISS